MGESKDAIDIFSRIARRMGYGMTYRGPARVADEIAKLVPGYGGVTMLGSSAMVCTSR